MVAEGDAEWLYGGGGIRWARNACRTWAIDVSGHFDVAQFMHQ